MKFDNQSHSLSHFSKKLFRPKAGASSDVIPEPMWTLVAYTLSFIFGVGFWLVTAYFILGF